MPGQQQQIKSNLMDKTTDTSNSSKVRHKHKTIDRFGEFCCRSLFLLLAILLTLPSIPFEPIIAYAEEGYRASELVTASVDIDTGEDSSDVTVDVNTEVNVNANHRSLAILDAAKIVNVNNTQKSDYKPENLQERISDIFPEYAFADITEYSGFNNETYRDVYASDSSTVADYKYKLEYLIKNNIINRITDYVYDSSGVYIGTDRIIHASTENDVSRDLESAKGDPTKPRYWDPSLRISKTDFLTELMKIGGVKESRIIAVQTNYSRTDENLRTVEVNQEPLELSPYQSQMGQLGIDAVNNDIVVDHEVFGQLNLMSTNDVVEAYLYEALNRGLISTSELGGTEGNAFLNLMPSDNYNIPGAWFDDDPLRQFYDLSAAEEAVNENNTSGENTTIPSNLHNKQLGTDDDGNILESYPKDIEEYLDIIYDDIKQVEVTDGLEYPWGNSYYYSVDSCLISNPTSDIPTEIIKRFSCVDVDQGMYDMVKYALLGEDGFDKGYQYFTDENITLAGAYVLAANFMKTNGEEPHINQQEIDYINSMYSLDFTGLLADEIEAVQYLIAKGILDPKVESISTATSTQLTNDIAVDLLYRIANPNYRCSFTPTLTDEDSLMLSHGYSQTTLSVDSSSSGASAEPLSMTYTASNSDNKTIWSSVVDDRKNNPGNYDYIYVRMPAGVYSVDDNGFVSMDAKVTMLVNNEYRTVIDPYNSRLNGGIPEYLFEEMRLVVDGEYVEVVDDDGEVVKDSKDRTVYELKYLSNIRTDLGESMHGTTYVYRDLDMNYWIRYIVNKDSSSNLRLQITFNGGTVGEYSGFNGEGVYYLLNEKDTTFTKVSLTDAETSAITHVTTAVTDGTDISSNNLYDQVIAIDIATRRYLGLDENIVLNTYSMNAAIPLETPSTVSVITKDYVDVNPTVDINTDETDNQSDNQSVIKSKSESRALKKVIEKRVEDYGVYVNNDGSFTEKVTVNSKQLNAVTEQGTATIGPISYETLKVLLLDEVNLIDTSGETPVIAEDNFNNKLTYKAYVANMKVVDAEDEGYYYINYTPQGTDVRTELGFIYDALNVTLNGTSLTIPGYAKYNVSGDEVVMISQDEIESWSTDTTDTLAIEILSDKMLYNSNTAQRAFINSDEHFTMIGNNITRYPDDTMMVNKFGEKVFYNLDILMELFADVNAVCDKMGSSVNITTNKTNCMSSDAEYRLISLMDKTSPVDNENSDGVQVDKIYALIDNYNVYVCLSALSDRASNMIYFKDMTHSGLEFLIVYYPKVTDGVLKHASSTNNGIIASMTGNSSSADSDTSNLITSVNTQFEPDTKVLSAYLFSGGAGSNTSVVYSGTTTVGEAASEVLPSGYQYDIYLLGTNGETSPDDTIWTDFVSVFQDVRVDGRSGSDVLDNSIMDDPIYSLYPSSRGPITSDSDNYNSTNIRFSFLPTTQKANDATTKNTGNFLFRDLASHNLYFRLVNSGTVTTDANGEPSAGSRTTNQYDYASYFKNRLYIPIDVAVSSTTESKAYFNRQDYFYKTPEGMTPLELYGSGDYGVGLLSTVTYSDNAFKYQQATGGQLLSSGNNDFKVQILYNGRESDSGTSGNGTNHSFNGNILEPFRVLSSTGSSDVGLFTPIRSSKTLLYDGTGSSVSNIFDDLAEYIRTGNSNVGKPVTVLDYFDSEMAYIFEKNYAAGEGGFYDKNGTALWSPYAARDYVQYGATSSQKSLDVNFNASIAGMYECTWDFLDFQGENAFATDTAATYTGETVESSFFTEGFKSFTTFDTEIDADGKYVNDKAKDYSYFYALTIGVPTDDTSITSAGSMSNLMTGQAMSVTESSGNKYSDTDSPMLFFTICQINYDNMTNTKPIAMAGIRFSDLILDDTSISNYFSDTSSVEGEDVLAYLFDKAWSYENAYNIYYISGTESDSLSITSKIKRITRAENDNTIWTYEGQKNTYAGAGDGVPIYYQPTYVVPAGTTVINSSGQLRTFLSDRIRSEINYLSDINNGILAKYLLTDYIGDTYLYLCDIPKNSKIVFNANSAGGAKTIMYNLNDESMRDASGNISSTMLDWVPTLMYDSDSSGSKVSYESVNDYTLAYKTYVGTYNIEVSTLSSQSLSGSSSSSNNGSKIRLGSTLGNGIWRLPTASEFKSLASDQSDVAESTDSVWVYPNNFTEVTDSSSSTGSYIKSSSSSGTITYQAEALRFKRSGREGSGYDYVLDATINSSGKPSNAYMYAVVNLPPTLVVEQDEIYTDQYNVLFYVNPELFGMDMNNKYIAYLETRDTPAEEIVAALDQSRSSNYDGNMFKVSAFIKWMENLLQKIWEFIKIVIPLIIIVLWTITTCLYGAVHYLSITYYYFNAWNDRLGFDIVSFLSCGVLGCNRTTRLSHYFLYSFLMWTAVMLIYSTLLQTTLLGAWTFFMATL